MHAGIHGRVWGYAGVVFTFFGWLRGCDVSGKLLRRVGRAAGKVWWAGFGGLLGWFEAGAGCLGRLGNRSGPLGGFGGVLANSRERFDVSAKVPTGLGFLEEGLEKGLGSREKGPWGRRVPGRVWGRFWCPSKGLRGFWCPMGRFRAEFGAPWEVSGKVLKVLGSLWEGLGKVPGGV